MYKTVLLALLLLPINPARCLPHHISNHWWVALKEIGTNLELTGPNCPWQGDFRFEFDWVYNKYREYCDRPSISECNKLPPYFVCEEYARFTFESRDYLERLSVVRLHWKERLEPYLQMAGFSYNFWRLATWAQEPKTIWIYRRDQLRQMKELVGEECWNLGVFPSPIVVEFEGDYES